MKNKDWFDSLVVSMQDVPEYHLEKSILEITEQLSARMMELGTNHNQLAEKAGVSVATIRKILRGESTFRLKTMVTMAGALETDLKIEFTNN